MKLLPGQEWDIEIEKAVEQADVVIVCLSNKSVDKEGYVQKELRFVLNIADEKPDGTIFVVPLRLDDCQVPRRIRAWQYVDYFPKNNQAWAYQRLIESLKLRAIKLGISTEKPLPAQTKNKQATIEQKINANTTSPKAEPPAQAHQSLGASTQTHSSPNSISLFDWWYLSRFVIVILLLGVGVVSFLVYIIQNNSGTETPVASTIIPSSTAFINLESPTPTETQISPTNTPELPSAIPSPTLGIGSSITSAGATMLYVPAGEFTMGITSEQANQSFENCQAQRNNECKVEWYTISVPLHRVYVNAFYIDKFEATNSQYAACVAAKSCQPPIKVSSDTHEFYYGAAEFNNYPVIYVDWANAKSYCEWRGARLPTEAEWEKSARGIDARIYPWGNTFNGTFGNFCDRNCSKFWANKNYDDGYADTAPAGSYDIGISPYGVYEMYGNVAEWVADLYKAYPGGSSLNTSTKTYYVFKGGNWFSADVGVGSANRSGAIPDYVMSGLGFRCAKSAP